jgi:SAM-dependent methyltransferase
VCDADITTLDHALRTLQNYVDEWLAGRDETHVLDAGCGSGRYLNITNATYVVGIDISTSALAANDELDEKIVGDLRTYALPNEAYDLIVCWDVLEHLDQPNLALDNFRQSLRPGGLLIVGSPNLLSFKGLATRFSPFWFHVLYYRLHAPDAYRTGHRPFPTFLRLSMSPRRIIRWASASSLTVKQYIVYENPMQIGFRRRLGVFGVVWRVVRTGVKKLSHGLIDFQHTDYILTLTPSANITTVASSASVNKSIRAIRS